MYCNCNIDLLPPELYECKPYYPNEPYYPIAPRIIEELYVEDAELLYLWPVCIKHKKGIEKTNYIIKDLLLIQSNY